MKQRSKLFVPNIVLGIVFSVFAMFSIFIIIVFHFAFHKAEKDLIEEYVNDYTRGMESYDMYNYGTDSYETNTYSILDLEDVTITRLGSEYGGYTPVEGSQYYLVSAQVSNQGTDYEISDYLGLYYYGQEVNDLEIMYPSTENDAFYYYNNKVVPACSTTVVENVLRIQDGVEKITVELYNFDSNGDYDMDTAVSLEAAIPTE